ncbi:MAG: suppressor of fused domain protein [Candidatus Obscuribacterales bacterium]|nr:suppressor of fused domain protein [Candidatus Obscuribacterales bacterium]
MIGKEAIDEILGSLYPGSEPNEWEPTIKYSLGGPDPLDLVRAYRVNGPQPYWHYISYGFTELDEKETDDPDISGYGFELTFKLAVKGEEKTAPTWPVVLLQTLGNYVFSTGNEFAAGNHVDFKKPITEDIPTDLTALLFDVDSSLPHLVSPHGQATFLQLVGITASEVEAVQQWNAKRFLELMKEENPLLITEPERASLLSNPEIVKQVQAGIENEGSSTGTYYAPDMKLESKKGLFGGCNEIAVTPNDVTALLNLLRGRILHGREGTLIGEDIQVRFVPANTDLVKMDDQSLALSLSAASAKEMLAILSNGGVVCEPKQLKGFKLTVK